MPEPVAHSAGPPKAAMTSRSRRGIGWIRIRIREKPVLLVKEGNPQLHRELEASLGLYRKLEANKSRHDL